VLQGGAITCHVVNPRQWHRFRALSDVHLIEVYWSDTSRGLTEACDPDDIERFDEGGLAK
jgi:hypothetical protein